MGFLPSKNTKFQGDVTTTAPGTGDSDTSVATTGWVAAAIASAISGGGIPSSLLTAKGQLVGASASATPVAIPAAAADGYALIADISQPGGVKWSKVGSKEFGRRSTGSTNVTVTTTHTTLDSKAVVGDNVLGLMIHARYLFTVAAGNSAGARIFDGPPATTQLQDDTVQSTGGTQRSTLSVYVPPWSGTKTFYLAHASTSSAGTVYINPLNPLHWWAEWVPPWVQAGTL